MSVPAVRAALVAVLTASTATVALASATDARPAPAEQDRAGCASPLLARPQPAGAVAERNPSAFRQAAQRNHDSATGFGAKAQDDELWLDRCGLAYYVEERLVASPTEAAAATAAPNATVPLSETLTLESKPGSSRTIYLDFTGDTVTGTAWNSSYGATIVAEPYSIDSTVDTNFSDAELTEIQKAWQVVAEDYAPFDVNVTTKDPGLAAIDRTSSSDLVYGTRALITNGGTVYDQCGCGGVAYVNVFNLSGSNHLYYQPAWVFSNGTTKNGKYMAEAISHEVGHNFGLNHDGTSTSGYYSGSAPWAPIMGAAYSQPVSQWSAGEYPGANNTQDDLAVIASGAPLRADDVGNTAATAAALTSGTPVNGVITTRGDVDAFSFTGSGATTVTVTGAAGLPDLDVQLTVLDSTGAVVAVVNPAVAKVSAYAASGLDATWSATLPSPGSTYTVLVEGVGSGNPATAGLYSDYASVGNYQVSLSTTTSAAPLSASSTTPPGATVGTAYSATPVTASGGTSPYAFSATGLPGGVAINSSTGVVSGTPTEAGTFTPSVTVTDAASASVTRSFTLTVSPAAAPPLVFGTASTLPAAKVRTAYSTSISVSGGTPGYTWALTGGSLPAGLTWSWTGQTATISGTPTKTSKATFTLRVTDSAGLAVTRTFTLQVRR